MLVNELYSYSNRQKSSKNYNSLNIHIYLNRIWQNENLVDFILYDILSDGIFFVSALVIGIESPLSFVLFIIHFFSYSAYAYRKAYTW